MIEIDIPLLLKAVALAVLTLRLAWLPKPRNAARRMW